MIPQAIRTLVRALIIGLGAGALVLGVGGRLIMRAITLATGGERELSLGGSLEVVLAGAFYGAVGAVLWVLTSRLPAAIRPALTAVVLMGVVTLSDAARGAAGSIPAPGRYLAIAAFFPVMLVYAYLLDRLGRPRGR